MTSSNTINVKISFLDKVLQFGVTPATEVEDIIIAICKDQKISPVCRPLFALKRVSSSSHSAWLNLSHLIMDKKKSFKKNYEFALRFNVPDVNCLRTIDPNTYNFYFKQARQCILDNKIPNIDMKEYASAINGLGVTDMFRAMVEDGLSRQYITRHYRDFLPAYVAKKHRFFLKKPIIRHFEEIRTKNVDAWYLKDAYLEQVKVIAPDYMVEEFKVLKVRDPKERLYSATIRVDPFDPVYPGIRIKEERQPWEHVCPIDELCYVNVGQSGVLELARKNGVPIFLKFQIALEMKSFMSLLDGYYRLISKWTFNLCIEMLTPSLEELRKLRCHGPVSTEFAYGKLAEKRNNEPGSFILRESDVDYDSYYLDVCTKSSSSPISLKIEKTEDGLYQLEGEEESYRFITDLLRSHRSETANIPLLYCLPPSEYDQSNLLLCQKMSNSKSRSALAGEEQPLTSPVCIDAKSLMVLKDQPKVGRSGCTLVYPGFWRMSDMKKRNVAVKVLEKEKETEYLSEFLSMTSRWAFVNANAAVKLYGITLSNPVSMVMENMSHGPLDEFLIDVRNRPYTQQANLVEYATHFANALYYLEEAKFVHGYIRCSKLLVVKTEPDKFKIKLADPGLKTPYTDFDLHWIPVEYHNHPEAARNSIRADVWAYATTLWQIFNLGVLPTERDGDAIKEFYSDPSNRLPLPKCCSKWVYKLMLECWDYDPYTRKTPQGVMRDISQIFYEVYNADLFNTAYTTIGQPNDPDDKPDSPKTTGDNSASALSEITMKTLLEEDDDDDVISLAEEVVTVPKPDPLPKYVDYQTSGNCGLDNFPIITSCEIIASEQEKEQGKESSDGENKSTMQSMFELEKEWTLVLKGLIGEGYYGEVYIGELFHFYSEKEPQKVAVKKLKRGLVKTKFKKEFDEEITMLKKLDHPNIVRIVGRIRDDEMCLVLEYVKHGSLKCYLNLNKDWLSAQRLLKYSLDIAKGMSYLREMKMVHRDLAARNILVSEFSVKISDFGLARIVDETDVYHYTRHDRELPIKWYAPESISEFKFSFQSDVWSYGVTLYEMFTYGGEPQLPGTGSKAEDICEALKNGIRLPMPPKCPQYVYTKIMAPCWQYEANDRPTFTEVCNILEDIFLLTQS